MSKKKLTRSSKLKDYYKKLLPSTVLANLKKKIKKHLEANPNDRQAEKKKDKLLSASYKKNSSNKAARRRSYNYELPEWMVARQKKNSNVTG
jgi:hypothetical protein